MKLIKPIYILLTVALLAVFFSCRSFKVPLMTESLYLQYNRVNIEYPYGTEVTGDPVLSEVVNLTPSGDLGATDEEPGDSARLDTSRVYRLDEVRVEVRSAFAPERNGHVAVDFLIRVPRDLISSDWRMTLTPELIDQDSVIPLKDVVLNGRAFRAFQEQGYAAYTAYENSIVSPDRYDEAFLDLDGISRDIRRRQYYHLDLYRREWERRQAYRRWKDRLDARHRHFNFRKEVNRTRLYHHYLREAEFRKMQYQVLGQDTTGLITAYAHKFRKRARLWPHYRLHRELNERSIPGKYRDLYVNKVWAPLTNQALSEKDSVALAKDRYQFEAIAGNELKKRLLSQTFGQLVPYPYRDDQEVKTDTLFLPEHNFFYLYRHEYPVTPGLKKLYVTLKGRVDARDLSTYTLPHSDTLVYVVSSLDQLIDTTLIVKRHKIYRDVKHNLTVYFKFPSNRWEFDIKFEDNRAQMDSLMNAYHRFTRDQGLIIEGVTLTAAASLDGNFQANARLSQRRADGIKAYLSSQYGREIDVANQFTARSIGEDWAMARRLIREHPGLPNQNAILRQMERVTDPDKVEANIRWGFKKDYQLIREEIYPKLRRVDIEFTMRRPNMLVTDSVRSEYRQDYADALKLLEKKEYVRALETLKKYADYNTALCLSGLGYHENARLLLASLEQTANVHYLSAIVLYQLGRKGEAAGHLMKACELDPDKVFRIPKDAEMKALVREYRLEL